MQDFMNEPEVQGRNRTTDTRIFS